MRHRSLKQELSKAALGIGLVGGLGMMAIGGGIAVGAAAETGGGEFLNLLRNSSLSRTLSPADQLRWGQAINTLQRNDRLARVEQSLSEPLYRISETLQKYHERPMALGLNEILNERVTNMQRTVQMRIHEITQLQRMQRRPSPLELISIRTRIFSPLLLSRTNIVLRGLSRDQQIGRMYMSYRRIREVMIRDLQAYDADILAPLRELTDVSKRENAYANLLPRHILENMERLAMGDNFDDVLVKTRKELTHTSDILSWHDNMYQNIPYGNGNHFADEIVQREEEFAGTNAWCSWRRANFNQNIVTPQSLAKYNIDPYNLLLPRLMHPVEDLRARDYVAIDELDDVLRPELLPS